MKNLSHLFICVALSLISIYSLAGTFNYELKNIIVTNAPPLYPRLDLSGVTSVSINTTRDKFNPEPQITSMNIQFRQAAPLTATNFMRTTEGKYRAVVKDAWVYREVIVELDAMPIHGELPATIALFVSEANSYLNPAMPNNQGMPLATIQGRIIETTLTRTVDVASLTLDGKQLSLSLQDKPNFMPLSTMIQALWMGKGDKTLYVPPSLPINDFEFAQAIGLILDPVPLPPAAPMDYMLRIKYRLETGSEMMGGSMSLRMLLNQAYGPTSP